jgi:ubiquinone biosynthesis accessory factor UbiJ
MSTPSPLSSLKPVAGRALEIALAQLLVLDPDTRDALKGLEGRRIGLALEAPALALAVTVDRGDLRVGPADADREPDLGLRATLGGLLSQLPFARTPGAPPVGKLRINGDAELARTLQQLAQRFDPDWDAPFARALGPVIGPQVARLLREALVQGRRIAGNLARDTADYLVEERREVVGRAELEAFHDDVDALRDRVERLAARLGRLDRGDAA